MSSHATLSLLLHEQMIDASTQGQIQSATDVLLSKHQSSWRQRSKPTSATTSRTVHHRSVVASVTWLYRDIGAAFHRDTSPNKQSAVGNEAFIQFDWLESVIHTPVRHKDLEWRSNQPLKSAGRRQNKALWKARVIKNTGTKSKTKATKWSHQETVHVSMPDGCVCSGRRSWHRFFSE